jgi:uncharacterized protein YggE
MENKVITVRGTGKVSAAPDLLVIEMNLEITEPEYEASIRRATEMLDALRAAVVLAGHDEKLLKTTSFNVNTKYKSYRDKSNYYQSKFVSYCCTYELRLEFDLDMKLLGVTLGAIAACEANPKFSIRFSVKDMSAVSAELLENAIENAKWKADILTKSAGVKLGAILRIDYNWSEHHFYSNTDMRVAEDMLCLSEAAPMTMDIEPEDINVSDTATVVWAIE